MCKYVILSCTKYQLNCYFLGNLIHVVTNNMILSEFEERVCSLCCGSNANLDKYNALCYHKSL